MSVSSCPSGDSRPPKYLRQKRKGRPDGAYVRIDGKLVYLGDYGTLQSRTKYAEVIAKIPGIHANPIPSDNLTVSELLVQFLEWANAYYDTREYGHFRTVTTWVRRHSGTRVDHGTCGGCGKESLPIFGARCKGCGLQRWDLYSALMQFE